MKYLVILNDAPYGSERTYQGLRLAGSLAKHEGVDLKVFLIGDAVTGAHHGQKLPSGHYNVQTMLSTLVHRDRPIGVCGAALTRAASRMRSSSRARTAARWRS